MTWWYDPYEHDRLPSGRSAHYEYVDDGWSVDCDFCGTRYHVEDGGDDRCPCCGPPSFGPPPDE